MIKGKRKNDKFKNIKNSNQMIQYGSIFGVTGLEITSILSIYCRLPTLIIPGCAARLYHLKFPCGL